MLRAKGWTQRRAASVLKVDHSHLNRVLRGDRHSESLLRRVAKLPILSTATGGELRDGRKGGRA